MSIRALIFEVAASIHGVGEHKETLKWAQPSHSTRQTKRGSLVRIDQLYRQRQRAT
jgi:hypothetical protein